MKPKSIDLSNKCGSCFHFEPIEGTCSGYCLRNKYGDNVIHDPEHPYWQVQRSRLKCADYNSKPQTNADHIRSMTDEELATFLECFGVCHYCSEYEEASFFEDGVPNCDGDCEQHISDWLKQPYGGDT